MGGARLQLKTFAGGLSRGDLQPYDQLQGASTSGWPFFSSRAVAWQIFSMLALLTKYLAKTGSVAHSVALVEAPEAPIARVCINGRDCYSPRVQCEQCAIAGVDWGTLKSSEAAKILKLFGPDISGTVYHNDQWLFTFFFPPPKSKIAICFIDIAF